MSYIPSVSPRRLIRALEKCGFVIDRQVGSHIFLKKIPPGLVTSISMHPGDMRKGLLMSVLKQAKVSVEELRRLL
jgi:predicted RNA binding protein YcfA (HicA-like mRNA interferase family)